MIQAICADDLTGREQLTAKVDYDQNKTFVYSMEVQNHCVVVKFILILFLLFYASHIQVFYVGFFVFFPNW